MGGHEPVLETVRGQAIAAHIPDLVRLRTTVFREWPYLYEGSSEYESHYLRGYADHPESLIVLARAGGREVGASTSMPLVQHAEAVSPPLVRAGFDPSTVYYFGESVLERAYRGRGIGRAFFEHREAQARALGYRVAAFCAVARAPGDPRCPPDYRPLDPFWQRLGFVRRPDIIGELRWRDLGEAEETAKPMLFWVKRL